MDFAEWLKDQMDERKMRTTDLAAAARLDDGIISRALRGTRIPSPASMGKIAKALKLPVDIVFAAAGYPVGNKKPKSLKIETLNHVVEKLPEADVDDVTEYARLRLRLAQRGGKDVRENT